MKLKATLIRCQNCRQARSIIDNLPAVAWMAYSIHNETSNGAMAAIYHF